MARDDSTRWRWVGRLVLVVVLAAISLHLALGAVEVLHRPVFPWDAWTNWIYRAKTWFLTGEIVDFDPIELWARGATPAHQFAVPGAHYPVGLPLLSLGVANALGFWSDTLVNLPAIACGALLAFGSFFVARDFGYPVAVAAVLAYLVISIPLVGAHLSLAGMADIWMALLCGLGFGLICSGLIRRRSSRWLAGLLLVALSTQLKIEGAVWTLSALLLVAVALRPRLVLGSLAAVLVIAAAGAALGIDHLELPLLGTIGVSNERLYVPFLGSYAMQRYELGSDYLSNFLLGGSWNLLWYLVAAAALWSALRLRRSRAAGVALGFFTVSAAAQVFIFFFTEQGAWADDWTAINRLPLHFAPALVLVSAFVLLDPDRDLSPDSSTGFSRGAAAAIGLAGALVASLALLSASTEDLKKTAGVFREASTLRTVIGGGSTAGGVLRLDRFDGNVALVSAGGLRIDAAKAPVARVATRGENRRELTFFWRSGIGGELQTVELAGLGTLWVDLSDNSAWKGTITELGLVIYDDGGTVEVESLSLHAPTIGVQTRRMLADWRWMAPWSQRSVNWIAGGNPKPLLSLLLTRAALLAVVIAVLFLTLRGQRARIPLAIGAAFLTLWVAGDLRWIAQRLYLAERTVETYPFAGSGPLAIGDDHITAASVSRATCDYRENRSPRATGDIPPRITIASDSEIPLEFQVLRAKYLALPVPAHAHAGSLDSLPLRLSDRVLVLKARYGAAGNGRGGGRAAVENLERRSGKSVRIAWEDENAFLLLVGDAPEAHSCWQAAGA